MLNNNVVYGSTSEFLEFINKKKKENANNNFKPSKLKPGNNNKKSPK